MKSHVYEVIVEELHQWRVRVIAKDEEAAKDEAKERVRGASPDDRFEIPTTVIKI